MNKIFVATFCLLILLITFLCLKISLIEFFEDSHIEKKYNRTYEKFTTLSDEISKLTSNNPQLSKLLNGTDINKLASNMNSMSLSELSNIVDQMFNKN